MGEKISENDKNLILVGHSFGASMILKFLSENPVQTELKGIFLIATPYWNGNDDWIQGLMLKDNFADKLPDNVPMFFYHCKDDEEIPFSQLQDYKEKLNRAIYREIEKGGHQLNNDLTIVAKDIESL
ncbi:alpha/beta hydrolase [Tamlana sp. 2_MG-2023]|uniref:alpha/beta hydrolase n=1 Tax=unclassified Tamlana TaxID=2614803 RepID=UPI0026E2EC53|nr:MULTISPECIES: alpha/beta hydrolase [unclassified Tamlana]MDO6761870.1 alpha/beta hydrolase [Tamlana sp. 2_MG-2023]MDO6792206.1 alpha/beta hydrolase [Tamlana sp. 1_MG-2023]